MPTRKVPRDPGGLELLRLYGALQPPGSEGAAVGDPARLEAFIDHARGALQQSLSRPSRLYGVLGQAMFRATVVALGTVRLLVEEDAGEPYYDDTGGTLSPPDFRLVDRQGTTVLVEVKTMHHPTPLKPLRLRPADVDAWRRWGETVGAPVMLAVWWDLPGLWTLTDLAHLQPVGGKQQITLPEALLVNEMARLGDRLIATTPPLTLRLVLSRTDGDASSAEVEQAWLLAAGRLLEDPLEQRIAWMILRFGSWDLERSQRTDDDGRLTVELTAKPTEEAADAAADQGFAMVWVLVSDDGVGPGEESDDPGAGFGTGLMRALTSDMQRRRRSEGGTEVEMSFSRTQERPRPGAARSAICLAA